MAATRPAHLRILDLCIGAVEAEALGAVDKIHDERFGVATGRAVRSRDRPLTLAGKIVVEKLHRHIENAPGRLDRIAFSDVLVGTQHHGTHRIALEVERQAEGVARKFEHLALHRRRKAVHAANTVGHRYHGALGANVGRGA